MWNLPRPCWPSPRLARQTRFEPVRGKWGQRCAWIDWGEIEEAAAAQRSCGQGSSCQRIKARTIRTTFSFWVFIFAEQPQAQQRPTRDASQNPRHAPRVNFSRKIRFKSKIVLNQFSCVVSGMRETKMFVCLCS